MKSHLTLFLTILLAFSRAHAQGCFGKLDDEKSKAEMMAKLKAYEKSHQLIIQLEPSLSLEAFLRLANAGRRSSRWLVFDKTLSEREGIHLFTDRHMDADEAFLDQLRKTQGVVSISRNLPLTFRDSIPNDELFATQWDMERIHLPAVWDIVTGGQTATGREIVIALLDKGFDLSHPDLDDNIWYNPGEVPNDGEDNDGNGYADDVTGWDFRSNSPDYELLPHGTWVSGILGAEGNNGIGTAGVNWKVKVMYLGVQYSDEVVAAFEYVRAMRERYNETNGQEGAFVVVTNGSFGIDGVKCALEPTWGSMYDPLGEVGVLSVAATANEDWDVDVVGDIPTSCPSEYLIAVTSTDANDKRVSNAAYGAFSIDLAAPGDNTTTTSPGGIYREGFGGTSSACPHVAGAISLLYSIPCLAFDSLAMANPKAAAEVMRNAILLNTRPELSLKTETVTGGILDVYEAMNFLHAWCIGSTAERESEGIKEIYVGQKGFIRVYPNPVSDIIKVDYSQLNFNELRVRIFNMLGQEVEFEHQAIPQHFEEQHFEIDVSNWPSGVYILNIFDLGRKISWPFVKR